MQNIQKKMSINLYVIATIIIHIKKLKKVIIEDIEKLKNK